MIAEPSPDAANASLFAPPSVPRSCIPPLDVHRKARVSLPSLESCPTTAAPSPETPHAWLCDQPGSTPRPWKLAGPEGGGGGGGDRLHRSCTIRSSSRGCASSREDQR